MESCVSLLQRYAIDVYYDIIQGYMYTVIQCYTNNTIQGYKYTVCDTVMY